MQACRTELGFKTSKSRLNVAAEIAYDINTTRGVAEPVFPGSVRPCLEEESKK